MSRAETHTTTIQRLIEIAVTVERIPGTAPTWHPPEPGEPDQYGIVEARAPGEGPEFRQPIELTASEKEEAIGQVIDIVCAEEWKRRGRASVEPGGGEE
jgi:hypothetical protein